MANACHKNQIAGLVEFVARQITAAPTRNNEFSKSTLNGSPDARLMRQNLQSIQDEIQQFTSPSRPSNASRLRHTLDMRISPCVLGQDLVA